MMDRPKTHLFGLMMGSDGKTTFNFTEIGEAVLSFEFNNADNFSSFIVLSFNIITFTKILNLFDGAITHFDRAFTVKQPPPQS